MFWLDAGPGDRVTIEKSWMDGSDRSSLTVLTTQAAHSLTADVAASRLYWVSDSKKVRRTSIHLHDEPVNTCKIMVGSLFENDIDTW